MTMGTRKLFVLAVSVWDAADYFQFRDNDVSCNPGSTDLYLFATESEAEQYAETLNADEDVYNTAEVYMGELTEDEILELTGYETINEFDEVLAEPYSKDPRVKNLGEFEKKAVAEEITNMGELLYDVECPNYDFDKSLDGALLVFWSWQTYIGYARKLIEVRYGTSNDKEQMLTKQDKVYVTQCDILMAADEIKDMTAEQLEQEISERLRDGKWKWTNPGRVTRLTDSFCQVTKR